MGLTLGGLSVLSFNHGGSYYPWDALAAPSFRNIVWLLVISLIILLLAYFTNPNEASFRKFLTELAFRHHLTRLSAADEFPNDGSTHNGTINNSLTNGFSSSSSHRALISKSDGAVVPRATPGYFGAGQNTDINPRFQFSSRASVSLRTPSHVFRSFGFFTIAVVSPVTPPTSAPPSAAAHTASSAAKDAESTGSDGFASSQSGNAASDNHNPIAGSWFIGAFGSWWMGGRVVSRSRGTLSLRSRKGEELGVVPSRVGLIGFRSLDAEDGYEGYKLIAAPFNALTPPRGLRQRSSSRSGPNSLKAPPSTPNGHSKSFLHAHPPQSPTPSVPARSSTPPLPSTATLPLHAKRVIPTGSGNGIVAVTPANEYSHPPATTVPIPDVPTSTSDSSLAPTAPPRTLSRQPSTASLALEQSPVINELMAQLSVSQGSVNDLRNQLSAFESAAAAQRTGMEQEVETHRAKKRLEDAARLELRAKIKALEEEKRNAEGVKREGEKKVRNALAKREEVERRMEKLKEEIARMREKIEIGVEEMKKSAEETNGVEVEIGGEVELKKKEIDVCEKVLTALNERVKEVEMLVAEEKVKVEDVKSRAERRREVIKTLQQRDSSGASDATIWTVQQRLQPIPIPIPVPVRNAPPDPAPARRTPPDETLLPVPSVTISNIPNPSTTPVTSPRPRPLSLGVISNLSSRGGSGNNKNALEPGLASYPTSAPGPSGGGSVNVSITGSGFHSRFSPFDMEQGDAASPTARLPISPISPLGGTMSLIPSGIMESPGLVERNIEVENYFNGPPPPSAPAPFQLPGKAAVGLPELNFHSPSPSENPDHRFDFDAQRAIIKPPTSSAPLVPLFNGSPEGNTIRLDDDHPDDCETASAPSRRWFTRDHEKEKEREKEKSRKGLNPDAKIFRRKSSLLGGFGNQDPVVIPPSVDPLNPSGIPAGGNIAPSIQTPRTSFFSSLRAFQPSPAEREALRLAMESSNNSSLERVSSRGSHHSGHSPTSTSPRLNNPFATRQAIITHPHALSGVDFTVRHHPHVPTPGGGSTTWTPNEPPRQLPLLTTTDMNGTHDGLADDEVTSGPATIVPPYKKTFSFNPWRQDKLLGGIGGGSVESE